MNSITLSLTEEKRFWEKVDKKGIDDCWEWMGGKNKAGYGRFKVRKQDHIRAHRISWILVNGPIPEGLSVLHKCDNRSCVNPNHLFLGTQADNMLDMKTKGRNIFGDKHKNAKLKPEDVYKIRELLNLGTKPKLISKLFNISRRNVAKIKLGKAWNWLR